MCRRMSVTNAMDVLRDRLRAAIKRRQADEEESWAESWSLPTIWNMGTLILIITEAQYREIETLRHYANHWGPKLVDTHLA